VPIAAVEHPTSGLGPSCGPTHNTTVTDNVAVPLVGRGYAVVATDYAGMGVDNGMTSYLIGDIEAAGALDAVRALLVFREARFDASQLGTDFFVLGHSQGGHAALFAHADFDSSLGVNLLGSVSFAPGLGDARLFRDEFDSASSPDSTLATFTSMALYTQMTATGGPDASAWLTPSAAMQLPGWFRDQCDPELLTTIEDRFAQQGDLYQPAFMLAAAGCPFTAPCASFEPWSSELIAQQPGAFASTAPALLMQGGSDAVVLPESTACIAQRLAAGGTPVQACEYAADTHTTIVGSSMPDAFRWMAARRLGTTPDVCPAALTATCQ
jgi:pimeloyl-ACP methyl ester carboxylesterase